MEENKQFTHFLFLKNLRISDEKRFSFLVKICFTILLIILSFNSSLHINTTLTNFFKLIFFYLVISDITYIIQIILISIYKKKNKQKEHSNDNFILGLERLFVILNIVFYVIFLITYFVIDFVKFLTTVGLFSVAFAWLFKEKFSNVLEGLSLLFSSEIRIGDFINVNDFTGRVLDINLSNTTLKTDGGDTVYIPNSLIMNSVIINYSKSIIKKVTYDFSLSSLHFKKISRLEKHLSNKILKEFSEVTDTNSIKLKLDKIHENSVDMTIEVVVTKYNLEVYNVVRKFISKTIIAFISRSKSK